MKVERRSLRTPSGRVRSSGVLRGILRPVHRRVAGCMLSPGREPESGPGSSSGVPRSHQPRGSSRFSLITTSGRIRSSARPA